MSKNSSDSPDSKSRRQQGGDSNRPKSSGPNHSSKDRDGGLNRPRPWLFLAIALSVVAIAYTLYENANSVYIRTSDLRQLIEVTRLDSEGQPVISGTETGEYIAGDLNEKTKVRLKNLRIQQINQREVRGKVTVEYLDKDQNSKKPEGEKYFTSTPPDGNEAYSQFLRELNSRGFQFDVVDRSFFDRYGPTLVTIAIVGGLLFFFYTRMAGGAGPMQFARSRGRLYANEDHGISFNSVAGIDEAVEEVKEVVDFLSNAEKYQRLGGRIPKGVLLVGPPGTGKTLLAKAVAGEAGVPFFSLSGSDFVEMFVGVGAARVRDTFQQAVAKSPCIIFIDELDALGKSRGNGAIPSHDEREQTLNALLVEMDGFDSNSGVIVMAATNRPETLDAALLRPGRFDRQVLVDRPDIHGREKILSVHVKNVKLADDVNLKHIAAMTSGFVGADLANLVNEAALLAARKDKDLVTIDEFYEGIERVTAGLEKKKRVMNEDEKRRVAYHEAGHALVAYALPNTDPVHKVSIIPRGFAALGYTMQRPDEDRYLMTKGELESQIKILLAGTLAEELVYPEVSTGAQNDLERATDLAYRMVTEFGMSSLGRINYSGTTRSAFLPGLSQDNGRILSEDTLQKIDAEVQRIIDEQMKLTRQILEHRSQHLEDITVRLMEVESVGSEELKQILGPRVLVRDSSHTIRRDSLFGRTARLTKNSESLDAVDLDAEVGNGAAEETA
ncbi:MAG: ATP-dependent zinc metalloprotease FtsH [Planctomycetaceae bacterium]|nr:ATP-dependent zinc metalloprotease FtsH [Planctomycetaceae bacterium]